MKKILWLAALVFCAQTIPAQVPVTLHPDQQQLILSGDPHLAANKKLVFDFWREVFQTHNMELAPQYMAEDYIQHNPNVKSGRQPFMDYFGQFEPQPLKPNIDNLVNLVAEGDLVVLAFRQELPDPGHPGQTYTTTWFDMLRIENGKIAEHWDYGTKPVPED
jgi:predicted SnoaL-like aldol condensation-catalyzing enzyme